MPIPDRTIAEEIEDFRDALPYRRDILAICGVLARNFYEHRHALWPSAVPAELEADGGAWFAGNVSATLTTLAALYRVAQGGDEAPEALEFLGRMAWLPELLAGLSRHRAQLDG